MEATDLVVGEESPSGGSSTCLQTGLEISAGGIFYVGNNCSEMDVDLRMIEIARAIKMMGTIETTRKIEMMGEIETARAIEMAREIGMTGLQVVGIPEDELKLAKHGGRQLE